MHILKALRYLGSRWSGHINICNIKIFTEHKVLVRLKQVKMTKCIKRIMINESSDKVILHSKVEVIVQ